MVDIKKIRAFNSDLINNTEKGENFSKSEKYSNNKLVDIDKVEIYENMHYDKGVGETDLTVIDVINGDKDWIYGEDAIKSGQFGGYQGSLEENDGFFMTDPIIHDIVKKYYPDIDFTEVGDFEQLSALFSLMNNVGCGYIACINTFMDYYYDSPYELKKDFYSKFGFYPLDIVYDDNGNKSIDYNYEYLFLDFFLYYAKNYKDFNTMEDVIGNARELDSSGDDALIGGPKRRTGMDGTDRADVAEVFSRYLSEYDINLNIIDGPYDTFESGVEIDGVCYYDGDGGEYVEIKKPLTKKSIDEYLENDDYRIIIYSMSFPLYLPYDENGNGKLDDVAWYDINNDGVHDEREGYYESVGHHAMTVVGTTSDPSKIVVSSWGKEFVMDLEDCEYDYVIYDYSGNE